MKIKERLPSIKGSHDDEGTDGEMSFPEPTQEQKSALLEFDCLAPGTERSQTAIVFSRLVLGNSFQQS